MNHAQKLDHRHGFVVYKDAVTDIRSSALDNTTMQRRIDHLESLGINVSRLSLMTWWKWYECITPQEPMLPLLKQRPGIYARRDGAVLLHLMPRIAVAINGVTRVFSTLAEFADAMNITLDPDDLMFEAATKAGFGIPQLGQPHGKGPCFAPGLNIVEFLRSRCVAPDVFVTH